MSAVYGEEEFFVISKAIPVQLNLFFLQMYSEIPQPMSGGLSDEKQKKTPPPLQKGKSLTLPSPFFATYRTSPSLYTIYVHMPIIHHLCPPFVQPNPTHSTNLGDVSLYILSLCAYMYIVSSLHVGKTNAHMCDLYVLCCVLPFAVCRFSLSYYYSPSPRSYYYSP